MAVVRGVLPVAMVALLVWCGHSLAAEQPVEDGTCDAGTGFCSPDTGKYAYSEKMEASYQDYKKTIVETVEKSLEAHVPCSGQACYQSMLDTTLDKFPSGIQHDQFVRAKAQGVHYQIVNHKLYRQSRCNFPARCEGVEHFLLEILDELDDMEFILNVQDFPRVAHSGVNPMPVFSFSRPQKSYADIMYPAWTFWAGGPAVWPIEPRGLGRWDLKRDILKQSAAENPWETKKRVAFFRGSRTSSERDPLVLLSREHPEIAEAAYTKNQAWKSLADTLGEEPAEVVKLKDHCQYAYLFNFRGVAASFRHKHLFLCKSLVFHVGDQRNDWLEFYYKAMKPWVHYVPVAPDLKSARFLLRVFEERDDLAQRIAQRGYDFVDQNLRIEDVARYWKELMADYGNKLLWAVERDPSLVEVKP